MLSTKIAITNSAKNYENRLSCFSAKFHFKLRLQFEILIMHINLFFSHFLPWSALRSVRVEHTDSEIKDEASENESSNPGERLDCRLIGLSVFRDFFSCVGAIRAAFKKFQSLNFKIQRKILFFKLYFFYKFKPWLVREFFDSKCLKRESSSKKQILNFRGLGANFLRLLNDRDLEAAPRGHKICSVKDYLVIAPGHNNRVPWKIIIIIIIFSKVFESLFTWLLRKVLIAALAKPVFVCRSLFSSLSDFWSAWDVIASIIGQILIWWISFPFFFEVLENFLLIPWMKHASIRA